MIGRRRIVWRVGLVWDCLGIEVSLCAGISRWLDLVPPWGVRRKSKSKRVRVRMRMVVDGEWGHVHTDLLCGLVGHFTRKCCSTF